MDSALIIENKPDIVWLSETSINDRINSNHYRSYMTKNELEIKNSGLEVLRIKDIVVNISRGKGLKKDDRGEIPNYKVRNLTNFGINKDDVDLITHREFINNKSSHIKIGDVLLASTGVGSLGKVDLFFDDIKATVDGHITILTTKEEYDGGYLKAYLQSRYGQIFIEQNTIGSTGQTELYAKDIGEILIPIPSPEIQKYIGDKVRRAEELREEAKRLKDECEDTIVRELKKSCGLDNISYKEHAGKLSVDKIYDKQKSTFVSSKLIGNRIDPKFYHAEHVDVIKQISNIEHYSLKDTLKEYDTGVSQLKYSDRGIPVISTGNMNNNFIGDPEKYTISNIPNSKYLNEEDVLITTYGATSIGKVDIYDKTEVATFDYTLFRAKFGEEHPAYYMCLVLRTDLVQKQIKYSINSGGGTNFVNISSLLDIKIPKIKPQIMNVLNELMKKSLNNIRLSQQLILQAKQDVEDLIEGNFEMSELNKDSGTESRCKGA
ncbi:restriction endonuclease subunit S [Desulfolucanica intricata]|uniref:restriction endonuclease subunit S n=1 Tax=Desulfolucanica intricata TaxID=1285191 RepID=UPI000830C7E4|nr:restriction endonuclease subunit S [Desulfolucanica intricata]